MSSAKLRVLVLLIGDAAILYLSLIATLLLRYQGAAYHELLDHHLAPFSVIFIFWIVVFYIAGLYDIRRLHNNLSFLKTLLVAIILNAMLAVLFFYFTTIFGIAPKTNFFTFLGIFTVLEFFWRRFSIVRLASRDSLTRVLMIGSGETAQLIHNAVHSNPQLGYTITRWLKGEREPVTADIIREAIAERDIELVLISRSLKEESAIQSTLYDLLNAGIDVRDFRNFHEVVLQKVPVAELDPSWFISDTSEAEKFYDPLKRALEFIGAALMLIILLPLELLIALIIRATSSGPIVYRQQRVGQHGSPFMLYKFRTMRQDAEKHGAEWSRPNDNRVTSFGKLLRHSHLDELPQLWNIVKGELSFVGPRPERPEFVSVLAKEIPFYAIRHLITPGITGWAQINYRYGSSVQDAKEKLEYDLYYLKNRSLIVDGAIILKTIKLFFINNS